jgi:hypothetical protein
MERIRDYQGTEVRLTSERLGHIRTHPEMVDLVSRIPDVLSHPDQVLRSRSDPDVRLFYQFAEITLVGEKWLCVVVKSSTDDAFVLTAYLTDKPKRGEREWPKP